MFTTHQISIIFLILSLHILFKPCDANCSPSSSCGIIHNISFPFHLNGTSNKCGDPTFELACEKNVTSISLNSHKYYVKAITYSNYTGGYLNNSIRLVDASINNNDICSFPAFSTYVYNFTYLPYGIFYPSPPYKYKVFPINFISCPTSLRKSSLFTDVTTHCVSNSSHHRYIRVGRMNASEVPYTCRVDLITMTSLDFEDLNNVSLSQIHESLLYGFELYYCPSCGGGYPLNILLVILWFLIIPFAILGMLLCALVSPPVFTILGFAAVSLFLYDIVGGMDSVIHHYYVRENKQMKFLLVHGSLLIIELIIVLSRVIIFLFVSWFLIYKFRRRHLSEYSIIESYLQSDNKLLPIRYSYSDIKRMTRGFQEKLGEGGYGCVYKGKLRSGHDVAIKMLGKAGGSGRDFMNEIATIGRIHHVNVVKLVGYVAQGSKRGLIFDFMPNGSLDKYLFNQERMNSLNWVTKFDIAVGIARGLEYLHRGCGIQILHFDIKPHNILLDHNFIPKISDFGLAKLCSVEKETVTLTAARGTIGYVAPELINRGIGRVSSKADVYSFGMLLIEMVGLNRELRGNNDDSTKYFPYWIYDHVNQGNEIEIEKVEQNNDNEENEVIRKMTIVALWCIQMSPDARPSMNQVLGMLETDVEHLRIPETPPSQPTQITGNKEESWLTDATDSASLLHQNNSSNFEITIG